MYHVYNIFSTPAASRLVWSILSWKNLIFVSLPFPPSPSFSFPLLPTPSFSLPLSLPPQLQFYNFSQDYKAEEDPAKFKSIKTGRGPLGPNWKVQFTSLPPGGRALHGQTSPQGGWARGESEVGPLSYLPACMCVSNTARTCKSERLPVHVCIQTGYCQVQVVGPAEQSGKLYT